MSNGTPPSIFSEISNAEARLNDIKIAYSYNIIGGDYFIKFEDDILSILGGDIDEIFRYSKNIMDHILLSFVARDGIGLIHTIEFCALDTGKVIAPVPDQIPTKQVDSLDLKSYAAVIGCFPFLRWL